MHKLIFIIATALTLTACDLKMPSVTVKKSDARATKIKALFELVTFPASDGETVHADLHDNVHNEAQPVVILFHQTGANGLSEYKSITPKLKAKGYTVLQVDQRSGGSQFGGENRTVKARGGKTEYCEAYLDMEGALSYVKTNFPNVPIYAWGSSYSAALVLKLASEHGDDLAGVLSFSPATGRAMGECNANNFISSVSIPALGIRPDSEMGKGGQAQKALYDAQGLDYFVAKDGVHGSSMLDPSRAKGDTAPTWDVVWAFLDTYK